MTPDEFLKTGLINPECLDDYKIWLAYLQKWNRRINLVAPKSLPEFWSRHALDSAQILSFLPETAKTIVDFGSGAGFPALAIAIDTKHSKNDRCVHLIESVGKKANFLKTVSRETKLKTLIHADRIEKIVPLNADIVTARAFAPLSRLLPLAYRHLNDDGSLVLLKGEAYETELANVKEGWSFAVEQFPSRSDAAGVILTIQALKPL